MKWALKMNTKTTNNNKMKEKERKNWTMKLTDVEEEIKKER